MRYRGIAPALLLIPLAACDFLHDDDSSGTTVRLGESVELGISQTALVEGTSVYITFEDVLSDERCPLDSNCIQDGVMLGDATVRLRAARPGMIAEHADVGLFQKSAFAYASVEFSLERLDPWPTGSGETIPRSQYRATISTRAQPPGS